jgi:DNA repair ATPase RecN
MTKKKGLSLTEHQELGAKLQRIRSELREAYYQLQAVYGKSSYPCKKLDAAASNLDAARCELDNFALAENLGRSAEEKEIALTCYYYGKQTIDPRTTS